MPSRSPTRHRFITLLATLTLLAGLLPAARVFAAAGTELFISEYIEGTSLNKAIEIYNPTPYTQDLEFNYSIQMYFNGSSSAGLTIPLTGTVAPGDVYVLAQTTADPAILAQADQTNGAGWFNGDDAVALVHGGTAVDVIGQVGFDPGSQWGTGDTSTADNTLRRKATITAGDSNGSDAFDPSVEWDGYATDTFDGLGYHTLAGENAPVTLSCGSTLTALQGMAATRSVSATDADGTVTSLAITDISPSDPGTITLDDVAPATEAGGSATGTVNVAATTPVGSYSLTITATNNDATPQTGTCTLTVSVQPVLTIGEVQGQTTDEENGARDQSPYNTQTVYTRGVVTQRLRLPTASGGTDFAFFLQSTISGADGDPLTSDGIYVYQNRFITLLRDGGGPSYFPVVGDEIVVRGPVKEYFNLTELDNPRLVSVVRTGVDLGDEVETTEANPPDDLADANRYWERHEGMRFSVPAGAKVIGPRDYFGSTKDAEVWVMRGDHPLAQRSDPYAQRVFRDAHPLDDIGPAGSFDNGNGMRIMLPSHGLKWLTSSNETLIAPARVFDTVTNELTGGLTYTFSKYGIETEQQLALEQGTDPALNAAPSAPVAGAEYATSDYNVENLYDFRDDPFDGCDFTGNAGCPGVSPPFDYVPASQAAYEQHLSDLATQIVGPMHAPDILMIQEAEDQDICSVSAGAMVCGTTNDADGQPDTLQDLALAVSAAGGPTYAAAYDRDGADDRGIVAAFLYRTDNVELLPADASTPVLGEETGVAYRGDPLDYNADVSNPKALNADLPSDVDTSSGTDGSNVYTRAPQVGHFRVWRDGIGTSVFTDLWAISNHFSSTPNARVGQRTEQAAYNAAIVDAILTAEPGARVVSAGDFNVYPRPDDPFAPGEAYGDDGVGPSDQLGPMYEAGLHNLWDVLVSEVPASAYSYVYQGQTQTLDMQWATDTLFDELVQIRAAHLNADFPAFYAGDVGRGASDHDPQIARWTKDVTMANLRALVDYYVANGMVDEAKADKLYERLDKAAAFLAAGQTDAYRSQLMALGDQAQDLAPKWVDPDAAAALEREADRLASLT